MKLSKFLRQNSRTLLMVFMSLLLIAFLVPTTIQGIGGGEGAPNVKVGQAYGRTVMTADVRKMSDDLKLLAQVGLIRRLRDDAVLDFYLLTEEAKQTGIRVSQDDIKAELVRRGMPEEALRNLQKVTQRNFDQLYAVFARWLAVERLSALQSAALIDSLPRQEVAFRDRVQEALAQFSVLDAKAFLNLVPEPTDEELQAFFDEAKDRATAHTADTLAYGYLLPNRVQVEYLTLDPLEVKNKLTIQAVQVKRFFEENAQRYTKPDPAASQPAAGGQPPQVPMTLEEAKERVREDYRQAQAIKVAQSLLNDIYNEAHRPWSLSTRGADGFFDPPASLPTFEELKERFSTTYTVTSGQTELLGAGPLGKTPGLGTASVNVGQQTLRFTDLALRVKGLLAEDPNDGKPVLNVMEPAPVIFSSRIDMERRASNPYQPYLFRATQIAPSAPPESMAGIRDQVVQDWKMTRAFALAREKAEALAVRAREAGLKTAVEEATALKEILTAADAAATSSQPAAGTPPPPSPKYVENFDAFTPPGLTRVSKAVARVGNAPNLVETIFKLGDEPAGEGAPKRVAAVPNINATAGQFRWVVGELIEIKPLYQETFEGQLSAAVDGTERTAVQRFLSEWTAPENVKGRARFTPEIVQKGPPAAP